MVPHRKLLRVQYQQLMEVLTRLVIRLKLINSKQLRLLQEQLQMLGLRGLYQQGQLTVRNLVRLQQTQVVIQPPYLQKI